MTMKQREIDLQEKYYFSSPYKVIRWIDSENTGAQGWVVIDKLINGCCGGGLFMHVDATLQEVTALARSMSYKNSLQDPLFGGAKGGIRFDPNHKEAPNVLRRFLLAQKKLLETIWCTGADLNTRNEEIFYITKKYLDLDSPFVSLANMVNKTCSIVPQHKILAQSLNWQTEKYFTLGDSITGYILAHVLKLFSKERSQERRIILQGFGKVGKSFAYYIYKENLGKIVGIQEKNWALYEEQGIDINNILRLTNENKIELNLAKNSNFYRKPSYLTDEEFLIDFLSKIKGNIFCPCAQRYTITHKVLDILIKNTFLYSKTINSYIISGANNVFFDMKILTHALNCGINLLPEWISNSGNALLFLESLKEKNLSHNWDKIIHNRILERIKKFLGEAKEFSLTSNLSLYEGCHEYSLKKIEHVKKK